MAHQSLRGRLLAATPDLLDPNFFHTVVFVLEHDERGALGLVLNRPSNIPLAETFPEWTQTVSEPSIIFRGGPVQRDALIGLARLDPPVTPEGWSPIIDSVGVLSLQDSADSDDLTVTAFRLYSGYAGWGGGQLESEINGGGWFTLPSEAPDLFAREPANLWFQLLHRHQGAWPWQTRPPADPAQN